ncbi:hypothetical protein C1645_423439 [Glomus cerebriforme]|uniref:BTB domain-containing protein n=1 Tax=Glomus cerebriforme TaxID=658196 RepID=A0A397SN20_9GLOM|nr:hypothetical protein C1645_423439 [Glomus cerebriforme]
MDLQRRYDPKILETGILSDHFDIEISVGEEPNTKTFHLNSSILQHQSNYFYRALSTHWIKVENNNIKKFQKPNISVEVFDIIVK